MAYHDQNPGTRPPTEAARATTHDNGSWNSHTRRRRFLTLSSDLSHTRRQDGLVVPRSTWPENLVMIWRHMRQNVPHGYLSCHHVPVHSCCCHLTSSDDIITPRQQPYKHLHISPSPCQRHVIGWCQWLCCSTCDPTWKPGTDPDQYLLTRNPGPVDFDFLR